MSTLNLDESNTELLKQLEEVFEISFEEDFSTTARMSFNVDKAVIHYHPEKVKDSWIAHELLHVWMRTFKLPITKDIGRIAKRHQLASKILSSDHLCNHIGNCMDHYKMYPKYLESGYKAEDFDDNGTQPKSNIQELRNLDHQGQTSYNASDITNLIGNLISILADPHDNDYSEHFVLIKNYDPDLYQMVVNFWNKWINTDISSENATSKVSLAYEELVQDLSNWFDQHFPALE